MGEGAPSPLHQPGLHESGYRHSTGEALYVDDFAVLQGQLYGMPVVSPHAHARIVSRDAGSAPGLPGVRAVLFGEDIPGINDVSPVAHDEPLLAVDEVQYVGQMVALVVAESEKACRAGAAAVKVEYEELEAVLDVEEAVRREMFHREPMIVARGDVEKALQSAALRVDGTLHSGGQDHFYLETNAATAIPGEDGTYRILSSTQHPSECQAKVAEVLGIGRHRVVVECPRMGGGFGGKESQAAYNAALAALAALHTGRPVRVRFDRDLDMTITGKRHPWYSKYEAGLDPQGHLLAMRVYTYANGGWSLDLSNAILQRCLFHLDNAYYIPAAHFEGRVVKTNLASNTAFRGFGGPQGMLVVEEILNRAAERLGLDPAIVRERNYYGAAPRDRTPYDQPIVNNRMPRIHEELLERARYAGRRAEIDEFNASSRWLKRGIAFQPVKFGISFTTSFLNQAGALLLIYSDGTVQLNHGGTEMGQGLHTKMLAVCAHELGVPLHRIRMMNTATDKVPNTSATAASSGSDLNGQAVRDAAQTLRGRLEPVARRVLNLAEDAPIVFENGEVFAAGAPGHSVAFEKVTAQAYLDQVPLSATGYYRTPDLHFDVATGRGKPFHYFAYGGAVTEVEVSGLTGEHRMTAVDILHDAGSSLAPSIDRGQVEGAFIQGAGWLTMEELRWDGAGRLLTHGPSTYKIPAVGDAPEKFDVRLLDRAPQDGVIHGSKAVGEPPLMLGISVLTALRHAIGGFGRGTEVSLGIPATPEAVLRAIEEQR